MSNLKRRLQIVTSLVLALSGLLPASGGAAASAASGPHSPPPMTRSCCASDHAPCPAAPSGGCVAVRGCDCCLRTPAPAPSRAPLPAADLLGRPDLSLTMPVIAQPAAAPRALAAADRADRSARVLRERLCVIRI